ncbi:bifunctional methylenetetrahydrofolate dehydrogenase/methenyltetrahydrofolate cyclohydrolase FolD [Anaplasma bovis]|uniref:bifunctional methylenetetrahydrofolate dehydrogenase/methenyltetrahydrofolate cyclohydrolase FolD n=1 Tax=Anaplasma bovis TaxID=186733 RepID=UPI002FEFC622
MSNIINGKLIAERLLEKLSEVITDLKQNHALTPSLAVIIVGENPASKLYVGNKQRKADSLGLNAETIPLPEDVTQEKLLRVIARLNADENVHGILVQLPLPEHIDKFMVINAIDPDKDVDGFHDTNSGKLLNGQMDCMIPCTPQGCIHLIKQVKPSLAGDRAVVIGRSNIVGKPVALLLLYENCTVSVLHSGTKDIENHCRNADIIVAAVGKAHFVKSEWVKKGAIVIDVGINLNKDPDPGKSQFVGDVDFDNVKDVAAAITPVPGGVGPMTIAFLMINTVLGACKRLGTDKYKSVKSSLLQ